MAITEKDLARVISFQHSQKLENERLSFTRRSGQGPAALATLGNTSAPSEIHSMFDIFQLSCQSWILCTWKILLPVSAPVLTTWPWIGNLTSQCFGSLTWKMKIIIITWDLQNIVLATTHLANVSCCKSCCYTFALLPHWPDLSLHKKCFEVRYQQT